MGQPTSPAPFRYPFRYPPSPGTCDLVGKPTARTFADLQELGGRGGIRTHEGLAPLTVFKTVAFVRSATLPAQTVSDAAGPCITIKTVDPATGLGSPQAPASEIRTCGEREPVLAEDRQAPVKQAQLSSAELA